MGDLKCKNADSLFILAHYANKMYPVLCYSIYWIFYIYLSKDVESHANLTSFVVACSIGNITIRDLQEKVRLTIKHTKIQVRKHWVSRITFHIMCIRRQSSAIERLLMGLKTDSKRKTF